MVSFRGAVVLGHRVDGRCGGDGRLLLLPGEQKQQDYGVIQEHGAAIRRRRSRRSQTNDES